MALKLSKLVLKMLFLFFLSFLGLRPELALLLVLELTHVGLNLTLNLLGETWVDLEVTNHFIGHSLCRVLVDIEVKGRLSSTLHCRSIWILNSDVDHILVLSLPSGEHSGSLRSAVI